MTLTETYKPSDAKKNIFKKITYTHSHTFVFKNVGFFVFHEKYLQRLTSINKQVEINS